jgi:hypothetical protein
MFEVVEVPFSMLGDDFFPEDAERIAKDTPNLEVFATFKYQMHGFEWASGENRVWDSGYLVVRV